MSSEIYFNNQKVFSGITNYNELSNASKPQINSVILQGNRTAGELNLMTKTEIQQLVAQSKTTEVLANYPSTPKEGVLYYIGSSAPYNVCLYAKNDQDVLTRVDLGTTNVDISSKQDVVDNNLTTTSKNIVGAINENKANIDLKQNITDDSLITTNKTIPTAINEIETDINAIPTTYAPLGSVYASGNISAFINPDNAVFNFNTTGAELRQRGQKDFFVQFTNPITSTTFYGSCRTEIVINNHTDTNSNTVIEQEVKQVNPSSTGARIVFKRIGIISGVVDATQITSASITWKPWYPVEYPRFAITPYATHISAGALYGTVTGGILTVRGDNIRFVSGISTTTADICRISEIDINAVKYVNGDNFQYSQLIAFNPSTTLSVIHLIGLVKRVDSGSTQLCVACWRGDVDYPTENNQTTFFSVSCGLGY